MLPFFTEIQLSLGETEQVMRAGNTVYGHHHPCPHGPTLYVFTEPSSFSSGHGE